MRARGGAAVGPDELKAAGLSAREVTELADKLRAPDHPDFELDLSTMRTADEVAKEMYEAVPGSFE